MKKCVLEPGRERGCGGDPGVGAACRSGHVVSVRVGAIRSMPFHSIVCCCTCAALSKQWPGRWRTASGDICRASKHHTAAHPTPPLPPLRSFTPRALTPRKLAAANPFAATPRRHTGLLPASLLSPRRPLPAAVASASLVGAAADDSPGAPEAYPRPSSAGAILQSGGLAAEPAAPSATAVSAEDGVTAGKAGTAGAAGASETPPAAASPLRHGPSPLRPAPAAAASGSPLRPPPGLAPIVAERLTLDEPEPPAAAAVAAPAAAALTAEPAAQEGLGAVTMAALEQAAEEQAEAEGGLLFGFLDRLHRAEAQALRLLKAWLDAAPSGEAACAGGARAGTAAAAGLACCFHGAGCRAEGRLLEAGRHGGGGTGFSRQTAWAPPPCILLFFLLATADSWRFSTLQPFFCPSPSQTRGASAPSPPPPPACCAPPCCASMPTPPSTRAGWRGCRPTPSSQGRWLAPTRAT